jgi:hypothetical protein
VLFLNSVFLEIESCVDIISVTEYFYQFKNDVLFFFGFLGLLLESSLDHILISLNVICHFSFSVVRFSLYLQVGCDMSQSGCFGFFFHHISEIFVNLKKMWSLLLWFFFLSPTDFLSSYGILIVDIDHHPISFKTWHMASFIHSFNFLPFLAT